MQDLVSVIVPVYKVEKYLDKCIQSIVDQTYKNLEIILVDDGSPDNCPKMCDDWGQKDSRIKVIHKQNGGVSIARNVAMTLATGKWIMFVDSDDQINANLILNLLNGLSEDDKIIIGDFVRDSDLFKSSIGSLKVVNIDSKKIVLATIDEKEEFNKLEISRYFNQLNLLSVWGKLYDLEFLKSINAIFLEGMKLSEDMLFNINIYMNIKKVKFIDFKGYFYYENQNSAVVNFNDESILSRFILFDKLDEIILTSYTEELVKVIKKHKLRRLFGLLRSIQSCSDLNNNYYHSICKLTKELMNKQDILNLSFSTKKEKVFAVYLFLILFNKDFVAKLYIGLIYKYGRKIFYRLFSGK